MNTNKRLTDSYNNAKVEYLNTESKYIIFSDIHRGDDSASDEFTRNQIVFLHALEYYYKNGYRYVEAGDGDELWEYSVFKPYVLLTQMCLSPLRNFLIQTGWSFFMAIITFIYGQKHFARKITILIMMNSVKKTVIF